MALLHPAPLQAASRAQEAHANLLSVPNRGAGARHCGRSFSSLVPQPGTSSQPRDSWKTGPSFATISSGGRLQERCLWIKQTRFLGWIKHALSWESTYKALSVLLLSRGHRWDKPWTEQQTWLSGHMHSEWALCYRARAPICITHVQYTSKHRFATCSFRIFPKRSLRAQ